MKIDHVHAEFVSGNAVSSTVTTHSVVSRDGSGNVHANKFKSANMELTHNAAERSNDTVFYSSDDDVIRKNTAAGMRASLNFENSAMIAATSLNVASNIVVRDVNGNFSAGTITAALTGNASTATELANARTINGVGFDGSGDITVNGTNYDVNDSWLKENGDNAHFKQYGNSRQMVFRTDGTTEYASEVGAHPFAWMYGGDAAADRRMLLNTSGQLWCSNYGWLHDKFMARTQTFTDDVANTTFTGQTIDHNCSGSDACTADRAHRALLIDVDSSATGGGTNHEHRLYGIYNDVRHTGDSDLVYGLYSYTRSDHASGTTTNLRAGDFYAIASGAGTNTNIYGINSFAYKDAGSAGITANMYGVRGEVQLNGGECTNAYVFQSQIDHNAGTMDTAYLYYGSYSGTVSTKWGIYLTGETKNYFSGDVGIGTTSPGYKLHVNGSSMFTSTINLTTSSGYAAIEMGGPSGAYIDLKKPASDDYDLRVITTGTGGAIKVGGVGDVMNFDGSGNVGINDSTPSYKLSVNGSFRVSGGNTSTFGNDGLLHINSRSTTHGSETVALQTTIDSRALTESNPGTHGGENRNVLALQPDGGYVGIGTTSPQYRLDVNGVARLNNVAFAAYRSEIHTPNRSYTGTVVFNNEYFDQSGNYDTGTGLFTAPVAGIYHFSFNAYTNSAGSTGSRLFLYKNNAIYTHKGYEIDQHGNCIDATIKLAANDTVSLRGHSSYPVYIYASSGNNIFCGHLLTAV